ncbi:heme NO-binding domain-containing protein [Spirosoma sp. SC4-14]|uniref:heme NO-binding domain-containing protein n=1 Tax=Spirosoma sp. SC4-14 TaxID=3128900 RepID=UPI0030D2800F
MKGIVFTELLEMIEKKFNYALVDHLLTTSELASGGIYTAVGTYDPAEMVTLVDNLSQEVQIAVPDLLRMYGHYMFDKFRRDYSSFIDRYDNAFHLLQSIQNSIHVEVKKIYPDAELPHFDVSQLAENHLCMYYRSERKLADFAYGLIEACLAHFNEKATIHQTILVNDGSQVRFDIVKL